MSIRLRILAVLSIMLTLACGLALYGLRGITSAGDLVVRLYDGPLMAINHARSVHAELNAALLILNRAETVGTSKSSADRFEKLVKAMSEDLDIVRERVKSSSVDSAREQATKKLRDWSDAALKLLKPAPEGVTEIPTTFLLSKLGNEALATVDDLVELVAAYGYEYRNEAESHVASSRMMMMTATGMTLVLGLVLALGFAYSLSRPIISLEKAMIRLADGDFDVILPGVRRKDEIGHVARAVERFKLLAAERAQREPRNHLVVAPRVPDQWPRAPPQPHQIDKSHRIDAVGAMRAEPACAKHLCKLRCNHAVGRSDTGITPVQIGHDELELAGSCVLDRHASLRFAPVPIRNIKHSGQFGRGETPSSPHSR